MSNNQNIKNYFYNNKLLKKISKMVHHKKHTEKNKTTTPTLKQTPTKSSSKSSSKSKTSSRNYTYIKKLITQYYDNDAISNEYLKTAHKRTHIFLQQNRIIVIGDIHGDLDMAITCLIKANCIENIQLPAERTVDNMDEFFNKLKWIGANTYIVQLGDQIDRVRPQNWNRHDITNDEAYKDEGSTLEILYLFHYLDQLAREHQGRVFSIIGNHELMNVEGDFRYVSLEEFRSFKEHLEKVYHRKSKFPYHSRTLKNNQSKLSKHTKKYSNPFDNLPVGYRERLYAFSPTGLCSNIIGANNYSMLQIGEWLFCHGSPVLNIVKKYKIDLINNVVAMYLLGIEATGDQIEQSYDEIALSKSKNNIFWNRKFGEKKYENEEELCKDLDKILKAYNETNNTTNTTNTTNTNSTSAKYIAVGHTPQFFHDKGINSICDGKVWRCDVGMSKAFGINSDDRNRKPQILEITINGDTKIINVIE